MKLVLALRDDQVKAVIKLAWVVLAKAEKMDIK